MFPKVYVAATDTASAYVDEHLTLARLWDRLLNQMEIVGGIGETSEIFLFIHWFLVGAEDLEIRGLEHDLRIVQFWLRSKLLLS